MQPGRLLDRIRGNGLEAVDHTGMVDVDQISATIARDCPDLRGLGGGTDTLSTQTATDAKPPVRARFGLVAQS